MDFPGGPVVKTLLSMQRTWVQSLVGELRSHMQCGAAKKKKRMLIQLFGNMFKHTCFQ